MAWSPASKVDASDSETLPSAIASENETKGTFVAITHPRVPHRALRNPTITAWEHYLRCI
jgi:hypothetical protein